MRGRQSLILAALLAAAAAVFVDQGTKWLILHEVMQPPRPIAVTPFLTLRLGFNAGVSFGLFSGTFAESPRLLAALTGLVVAGLCVMVWRCRSAWEATALGLVIGGAAGNIADRLRFGAVVDFLDFHYAGWSWPAFNAADVAIVSGVLLFLLVSTLEGRSAQGSATEDVRGMELPREQEKEENA